MDRVNAAPQTRAQWLGLAQHGREVRGQATSNGITLYTNKRGFFGNTFAFIKDPLLAKERTEQRTQGQNALRDFLVASSGLPAQAVQTAFARAGIGPGTPLTQATIQHAFDEVDREAQQIPGQRQQPPPVPVLVPVQVPVPLQVQLPVQVGAQTGVAPPDVRTTTREQVLAGINTGGLNLDDLLAHLTATSGLPPASMDAAFARVGLLPGGVATEARVTLALKVADYEMALIRLQGLEAPRAMAATRELGQDIDIDALPQPVRDGMTANSGCLTGDTVLALVRSGQLDLGIDPQDPTLNVRTLPISGGQTLGIFLISSSAGSFMVKEHGSTYLSGPNGEPELYYQESQKSGGPWLPREGQGTENPSLQRLAHSPFGDTRQIDAPDGVRLLFGHARATFDYVAQSNVKDRYLATQQGVPAQHQASVLHAAPGIDLATVIDVGTHQQKCDAARDFGRAVGAMHMQFTDHQRMPTGGLRTLVHGDLHPGNVFYDPTSRTVTAIDLSGAAVNFKTDPPGFDMMLDVARALRHGALFGAGPLVQQAFLEGYCQNPEIARLGYTPQSLHDLAYQSGASIAGLT